MIIHYTPSIFPAITFTKTHTYSFTHSVEPKPAGNNLTTNLYKHVFNYMF